MNKARRKQIDALILEFQAIQLDEAHDLADNLEAEEQEAFDTMPEALQGSDRGQASEQAAEELASARDAIEAARDAIQESIDALENAKG